MTERYVLKNGFSFEALQWAHGCSFEKTYKHCGGYFMHTQTGLVRIGNGDWAIKGKNGFLMVVKDEAFKEMFRKVEQ